MKMFIANTSRQDWDLCYRVPGVAAPRMQQIPVGQQRPLSGDLTTEDVEAIVEQITPYGAADASTIAQQHRHITLLYSTNKPVTENQMRQALERNIVVMDAEGLEFRKRAAVSVNHEMAESQDSYRGIELSVVEQRSDGGAPDVNEVMRVRNERAPDTTPRRFGKVRGRRSN